MTYFKCYGPLPTQTYLPLLEPWGQLLVQHIEFLCEKIKSDCLPCHLPRSPDSERNGSKMCSMAVMHGKILHKFQNLIISLDCSWWNPGWKKKQTAWGHVTGGRIKIQTKAPVFLNLGLCSMLQEIRSRRYPGIKITLLGGSPLVLKLRKGAQSSAKRRSGP